MDRDAGRAWLCRRRVRKESFLEFLLRIAAAGHSRHFAIAQHAISFATGKPAAVGTIFVEQLHLYCLRAHEFSQRVEVERAK
jgi:hypothetical protein